MRDVSHSGASVWYQCISGRNNSARTKCPIRHHNDRSGENSSSFLKMHTLQTVYAVKVIEAPHFVLIDQKYAERCIFWQKTEFFDR